MAAGGQAPYVEPWDLEKNETPQNNSSKPLDKHTTPIDRH
jgi:hypothetical protein